MALVSPLAIRSPNSESDLRYSSTFSLGLSPSDPHRVWSAVNQALIRSIGYVANLDRSAVRMFQRDLTVLQLAPWLGVLQMQK